MTRSSDKKAAECHVLDFFYDDDNGCALTVFINGVRFHIIADAERLTAKSTAGRSIEKNYKTLLSTFRTEVEQDEEPDNFHRRPEMDVAEMHTSEVAENDSQDSGHGTSDDEDSVGNKDDDRDSAVDISEEKHGAKEIGVCDSGVVLGDRYAPEAEKSIQHWMLSPFKEVFENLAPACNAPKNQTLEEWYHGPAFFFNLEIDGDQLSFSQEDDSADLQERMAKLVPRMPLPKYLKDLQIPMVRAKDITVLQEGTEPEPYHPVRVKVGDKTQFLKMVDMLQHQPTKREIKLLKEAENKGLHKKFHVPQVLGLVYEDSKSEIMGFLQTDIEDPTPLTKMLDSDVVEDNRTRWAKETERIIQLLHQHDIIWGDAKADNFMVDKHGELWIIDFGGSYTDGWVDPELVETKEGDVMGTEKIVNALEDPDANTFEPEDEGQCSKTSDQPAQSSKKRGRDDETEDEAQPSKRRK